MGNKSIHQCEFLDEFYLSACNSTNTEKFISYQGSHFLCKKHGEMIRKEIFLRVVAMNTLRGRDTLSECDAAGLFMVLSLIINPCYVFAASTIFKNDEIYRATLDKINERKESYKTYSEIYGEPYTGCYKILDTIPKDQLERCEELFDENRTKRYRAKLLDIIPLFLEINISKIVISYLE